MAHFSLSSPTFSGNVPLAHVYHDFGAGGENKSPELHWENPPEGTKSFLIICHDPDAPGPGGWWHWCAFDLPGGTRTLGADAGAKGMPEGSVQVRNSYGSIGYGGCCPPPGDQAHAYHLTIYALGTASLGLDENASPAMVLFVADAHVLGKAGIVGFYAR
ncbi:MAG: YbhB/YbcL family Raf kinase inhibitor-like protein [Bacteroidota bacterium]